MKRYRSLLFSFLLIGTAVSEPNSYASNPFLNGEYTNDINAFLADQARQNDVDLTSNVFLKRMINDQSGSASAQVNRFSGPEYLPPVNRCPGNQVCVYKGSCQSGYFQESNLVTSKKECDVNSEVCCTYRPPPTQPRATPCNGNDYACVPPNKCVNGFIKVAGSQKTSSIKPSTQCYGPGEICCRIPVPESTELTPDGYVVRVPEIPFETPKPTPKPYQPEPQPSQPKPYPQPTPPRPYQPQPTPPKPYQPQPTPPKPYQPQPTPPRPYQPQPTPQKPYQPKPTQPKPYQPRPTQPQPKPYQPTQKPYQPTQKPYQPTQKPYQPTPAPYEPTRKPTQTPGYLPPDRVPQPSDIYPSQERYPTTQKPYQPPTQKPYQPTRTPYQPTQKPQTPGYLPPDRVPEPSQTNPTRVPPSRTTKKPVYSGEDILSRPIIPQTCAAALNCTDVQYCTANGFISKTPVILTKDQELYRVPLTDCRDSSKGITNGKCCRDPDYTDPWPVTQLGRYDSSWFGDDGSYKPTNGNAKGPRPSTQDAQPSILKGNAVLNEPIGTGKGICTTRNFNGSPKGPGPDDAAFGEYPWQAMVLLESTKSLLCGGAIVGDDLVLTSAHCVQGRKPFDVLIKGGEWKLGRDEEPLTFQISRVKKIDIHPHYEPNTNANDLAVLHLDSKLKLEPHIAPICIDDIDPTPEDECVTTGWGKEALRLHAQDAVMKHSPVNMMTAEQCQKASDGYRYQQGSALCGATVADACLLDPGSALACANKRGHYVLKGLYSVEDQCGQGSVVTFSKIDAKWVNQATGGKNNPVAAASSPYTSNVKAPLYLPPTA